MSSRAYKSSEAQQAVISSYATMLGCWNVQLTEKHVDTQFGRTHIIESGEHDLPPLILLHGSGGNSTMWYPNIVALTQHFKVYAIDIIGEMGKSSDERISYDSEDYSLWLAEIFKLLSIEKSHVLGTSLGATLLIDFSIKFPNLIDKLVLVSPLSLEKNSAIYALKRSLSTRIPIEFITRRFYHYIISNNSPRPEEWVLKDYCIRAKAQRINSNALPVVTEEQLSNLPKATLLILGEDDPTFSVTKAANKVKRAAPDTTVSVLRNVGHIVSMEQPLLFKEALLDFIKSQ